MKNLILIFVFTVIVAISLTTKTNAHYLYNSLNNLYSLSLKKSAELPNMISDTAEIFRYLTEDTGHIVMLEKEILAVGKYLKLEKTKYKK